MYECGYRWELNRFPRYDSEEEDLEQQTPLNLFEETHEDNTLEEDSQVVDHNALAIDLDEENSHDSALPEIQENPVSHAAPDGAISLAKKSYPLNGVANLG